VLDNVTNKYPDLLCVTMRPGSCSACHCSITPKLSITIHQEHLYCSLLRHISIIYGQNEPLLNATNCIMLSHYGIPVITCRLQQQISLCVASSCVFPNETNITSMSTTLYIDKQILCLLQLATCFVFYIKAVFSLNYYYIHIDRSTLNL